MKFHVHFTETARAQLRTIPQREVLRILHKLTELGSDPYGLSTTALIGSQDNERHLRVGDYRVIYTMRDDQLFIHVVRVGLVLGPVAKVDLDR